MQQVKSSRDYEYLSKLIADKAHELSAEIVKLKSEHKEFTASTLIGNKAKRVKQNRCKTYSVSKSNGSLMRTYSLHCCWTDIVLHQSVHHSSTLAYIVAYHKHHRLTSPNQGT